MRCQLIHLDRHGFSELWRRGAGERHMQWTAAEIVLKTGPHSSHREGHTTGPREKHPAII